MIGAWLLLGVGTFCFLGSLNALWPPRRLWFIGLNLFFWGWFTSELALHALFVQVAVGGALIFLMGALSAWQGQFGLVLLVFALLGLFKIIHQGFDAQRTFTYALQEGLRDKYKPEDLPEQPPTSLKGLIFPFWTLPKVARHRDIVFSQIDNIRLKLDIYRTDDGATKKPVLVEVHGGAWVLGSKNEQGLPLMKYLASRGWVCVSVNYRLSPLATFPDHLIDVKQGLAWVKQHIEAYGGDPDFVVITGGSAGGHLSALAALTANQSKYQPGFEQVDTSVKACVPCYGVYDFTDKLYQRNPSFKWLLEVLIMKTSFRKDPKRFEEASPVFQIGDNPPPFFVVHGQNDTLVPVEIARHFVEHLREKSEEVVVYAELEGGHHAFDVFYSLRTAAAVRAIEHFLLTIRNSSLTQKRASEVLGSPNEPAA
jgi:acetyl esterase/lipase